MTRTDRQHSRATGPSSPRARGGAVRARVREDDLLWRALRAWALRRRRAESLTHRTSARRNWLAGAGSPVPDGMAQAVVPALVLSGIGYFSGALSINQAAIAFTAALVLCSQLLGAGGNAEAEALVGKAAPDVTFTDVATGKTVQVRRLAAAPPHPSSSRPTADTT